MNRPNILHLIDTMRMAARHPEHFRMDRYFSSRAMRESRRCFPTSPPTLETITRDAGTTACIVGWEASTRYARDAGFGWMPCGPQVGEDGREMPAFAPGGSDPETAFAAYLGVPLEVGEIVAATTWVAMSGRPDPLVALWPARRDLSTMRPVEPMDTVRWLHELLQLGPEGFCVWHATGCRVGQTSDRTGSGDGVKRGSDGRRLAS